MSLCNYHILARTLECSQPKLYPVERVTNRDFCPLIRELAKSICEYFRLYPEDIGSVSYHDVYLDWMEHKDDPIRILAARCFLEPEHLTAYFQPFEGRGSEKNRELSVKYLKETGKTFVLRYCSLKDSSYRKAYSLTIALTPERFEHYAIIRDIGDGYYFGVKAVSGNTAETACSPIKRYCTIIDLLRDQVHL